MLANSIKSQLFITQMSILEAIYEIFRQYYKQGKIELS